jgi:hypothetical protein
MPLVRQAPPAIMASSVQSFCGENSKEHQSMQLSTIDSTMLYAIGYDEATQTMDVVFNTGGIYRYTDVPKHVYDSLLAAPSKGRYMQDNVIGSYPYQRLHRQRVGRARRQR